MRLSWAKAVAIVAEASAEDAAMAIDLLRFIVPPYLFLACGETNDFILAPAIAGLRIHLLVNAETFWQTVTRQLCENFSFRLRQLNFGLDDVRHDDARRPGQGFEQEQLVQPCFGQQALIENDFRNRAPLVECSAGDARAGLVAEHGAERGDEADRIFNEAKAAFAVRFDAVDATLRQSIDRGGQHAQRLQNGKANGRLERVELKLTSLSAQCHREIMTDDEIGDLAHDLRDHRIDFPRHDRGTGLNWRQADFAKARARSRR